MCTSATPMSSAARLLSRYGMRASRRTGEQRLHAGIDIGAPAGSAVYTARPGRVVLVGRDADARGAGTGLHGYGNAVVVYHADDQRYVLYAHLQNLRVRVGQRLSAGQQVGTVGATSNGKFPGMGRHLHMEVRRPKSSGASPFPGVYGAHNLDPLEWLERHGIGIESSGFTVTGGACSSPVPSSFPMAGVGIFILAVAGAALIGRRARSRRALRSRR